MSLPKAAPTDINQSQLSRGLRLENTSLATLDALISCSPERIEIRDEQIDRLPQDHREDNPRYWDIEFLEPINSAMYRPEDELVAHVTRQRRSFRRVERLIKSWVSCEITYLHRDGRHTRNTFQEPLDANNPDDQQIIPHVFRDKGFYHTIIWETWEPCE